MNISDQHTKSRLLIDATERRGDQPIGSESLMFRLRRPVSVRRAARPTLDEDKGVLIWRREDPEGPEEPDYEGLLGRFCRLDTAKSVLDLASEYGPLWLCEHHLPDLHNRKVIWGMPDEDIYEGCQGSTRSAPEHVELVTDWLMFREQAQTALNVAATLSRSSPSRWEIVRRREDTRRDLDVLEFWPAKGDDKAIFTRDRTAVAGFVAWWLEMGIVVPSTVWFEDEDTPWFGFAPQGLGLFGVIALQLAMQVSRASELYQCSGCGISYARTRKRGKSGLRNFCETCRDRKEPQRLAKRNYARKKANEARQVERN